MDPLLNMIACDIVDYLDARVIQKLILSSTFHSKYWLQNHLSCRIEMLLYLKNDLLHIVVLSIGAIISSISCFFHSYEE